MESLEPINLASRGTSVRVKKTMRETRAIKYEYYVFAGV